jgi:hypothetical protein
MHSCGRRWPRTSAYAYVQLVRASSRSRSCAETDTRLSSACLQYVRNHLIWETGHDVDTGLVEEEVRLKLILWEEKRNEDQVREGEATTHDS